MVAKAGKEKHAIPLFAIFSPSDTPVIGDAVAASVVSQVNELNQKIDELIQGKSNKQKVSGFTSLYTTPNQLQRNAKPLTYAVVLENCPNLSSTEGAISRQFMSGCFERY